mgnify:CR=1 FL=1
MSVRRCGSWLGSFPAALLLLVAPCVIDPFQTLTLTYGLIAAIGALGFNLLLGYTGLLSFGHSAFFGAGAYTVAFMVKYLKLASMELFLAGSVLVSAVLSHAVRLRVRALYAHLLRHPDARPLASPVEPCVQVFLGNGRYRWSTVPTPTLLEPRRSADKMEFLTHRYYYYVLAVFRPSACSLMWVIVHSPFGKALQAIRDNEIRAESHRHPHPTLPAHRVRDLRHLHRRSGRAVGAAQRTRKPRRPGVDILRRDRLHDGARGFPHVCRSHRRRHQPSRISRPTRSDSPCIGNCCCGTVLVVLVLALPTGIMGAVERLASKLKESGLR